MTAPPHTDTPAAEVDDNPDDPGNFVGVLDLERDACIELLEASRLGRLAVVLPNGQPVIRPVNYLFDRASQSVVFRTGAGSKFYALVRTKPAAFEVDGIDPVERTGWSVIIQGVSEEITNPAELQRLTEASLDNWAPGEKPYWFRIHAFTVTGRRVLRIMHSTPPEGS